MKIDRRLFIRKTIIASSICVSGCDELQETPCDLCYANLSGSVVSGFFRIGHLISDSLLGPTLTSSIRSAKTSYIEGKTCRFLGTDIYSGRRIDCSATIPTTQENPTSLACEIILHSDYTLTSRWIASTSYFDFDFLAETLSKEIKTIPLLFIGLPQKNQCYFGTRQKSGKSTTLALSLLAERPDVVQHVSTRWIEIPNPKDQTVITYGTTDSESVSTFFRCVVNLNSISSHTLTNYGIWIEMLSENIIRLAKFRWERETLDEIRQAYIKGDIRPLGQNLEVHGKPCNPFRPTLNKDRFTVTLPDLRFDDEIEAQGLESPVRS